MTDEPEYPNPDAAELLGFEGRMVSHSKSWYLNAYPRNAVVFNANVCVRSVGKIWHGDVDLTLEERGLVELARRLDEAVYLLNERDARFRNELEPLFDRAVYSVTPSGDSVLRAPAYLRSAEGVIVRRLRGQVEPRDGQPAEEQSSQ